MKAGNSGADNIWKVQPDLQHDAMLRMVKALNLLLVTVPFVICWFAYYEGKVDLSSSPHRSAVIICLFIVLYLFFGRIYDAFYVSLKCICEMLSSQLLSVLMADSMMFLVLWLMSGCFPNIIPAVFALIGQSVFSMIWCRCAHFWYFSRFAGQRTGIICDVRCGMEGLFEEHGLDKKFDIQFICSVEECLGQEMKNLNGVKVVFLCGVHSHDRNTILKYCVMHGIVAYMIPRVGDVIMSGAKRIHMLHLPIVRVERYAPPIEYLVMKRLFDIVSSAVVIAVTSPIMLGVAIAIKVYDGGPVFYRQTRLTKNGREFSVLKFRSMRTDAEEDGVARLSSGEKDDRITPVGHFIRACRLDEMPQLFNILVGSMSVVGPRPERPEIAAQYEKELPAFAMRLQVKAGLTGLAQVYGRYNTEPYNKLQMDLMYINNASILQDIKLMLATVKVLFVKESTEGVDAGQMTAEKEKKPA